MEQENVRPAGEGLSDEQMVREVASQTDSDLKWQDVFARDEDGTTTETEAAKADADEVTGETTATDDGR